MSANTDVVPTIRDSIAKEIHYPACWDTAAYPTLEDAMLEIVCATRFVCSECPPADVQAEALNCDFCGATTDDPWHTSSATEKHLHQCDACHAAAADHMPDAGKMVAPAQSAVRYIVIGYGETDYPQAAFVNERAQLLNAVLGMMYMTPSDADAEIREAYARDLDDPDEWSYGHWNTEFEIGGITVYDLGINPAPDHIGDTDEKVAAPFPIVFPTMLRKMWSGSEVQRWLNDLPPLYTAPPATAQSVSDQSK